MPEPLVPSMDVVLANDIESKLHVDPRIELVCHCYFSIYMAVGSLSSVILLFFCFNDTDVRQHIGVSQGGCAAGTVAVDSYTASRRHNGSWECCV